FGASPVDPEIVQSCDAAARQLRELGHEVTEGALPFDIQPVSDSWAKIGNVCMSLMARNHPKFKEQVTPEYRDRAITGDGISGGEYQGVIELLYQLRTA